MKRKIKQACIPKRTFVTILKENVFGTSAGDGLCISTIMYIDIL